MASYSGIDVGPGKLGVRLALNFNKTTITDIDSTIIDGVDIFDRKEQSRIETARPADKEMLGITYRLNDSVIKFEWCSCWTWWFNFTRK